MPANLPPTYHAAEDKGRRQAPGTRTKSEDVVLRAPRRKRLIATARDLPRHADRLVPRPGEVHQPAEVQLERRLVVLEVHGLQRLVLAQVAVAADARLLGHRDVQADELRPLLLRLLEIRLHVVKKLHTDRPSDI